MPSQAPEAFAWRQPDQSKSVAAKMQDLLYGGVFCSAAAGSCVAFVCQTRALSNINFRGIFSFLPHEYEEWLFVRAA